MVSSLVFGLAFVGLSVSTTASSTATETIVIHGQRPRPAGWMPDRTVAAEALELTNRIAVNETMADVLREASGVRVLQSGGQGAFQGISVRGAEPDQTVVLIGDVPVAGTDRGAIDLGFLPLQAFERVEVFRSSAPAWLGQRPIGGVVRLIPRSSLQDEVRAELGAGSFGAYWARAEGTWRGSEAGLLAAATGRTASNGYPFADDRATPFVPEDDTTTRRNNAEATQVHTFLQSDWMAGHHRVEVIALGVHREQGEPGPGHSQATEAHRSRSQVLGTAAYTYHRPEDGYRVQAVLSGGWERDAFDDPLGEIGLATPKDTDDRFLGLQGRLAGQAALTSWLDATVVASARYDRYGPEDRFASPGDQPSERTTVSAAAEARMHGVLGSVDIEARPSVSLRLTEAQLIEREVTGLSSLSVSEQAPTVRFALFVSPSSWLSLQASVASANRLPTVLELFGNRGTLTANPSLRSERALLWDAGAIVDLRWAGPSLRLEARVFGREVSDLIRYRRTSQFTAVAENAASGRIRGAEGALRMAWRGLTFVGQLAWLDARDELDRVLPLRARWTGRAELEGSTAFASSSTESKIDACTEFARAFRSRTSFESLTNSFSNSAAGPVMGGTRMPDRVHDNWHPP